MLPDANALHDAVILAARLFLATLFLIFGWRKVRDYSGTVWDCDVDPRIVHKGKCAFLGPWRGSYPANRIVCVIRRAPEYVRQTVVMDTTSARVQVTHFPGRRKTVTVVLPPPISGATKLYTPTKPETTATFCTSPAL